MLHRLPIFFFLLLLSISNSFAQGRCLVSNGAFNVTNSTFGINIQRGAAKPWECLSSQSNSAVALCNIKSKSASYSVILAGGRDAPSPYRNPYYSGAVGQPLVAPLVPNKKYALHFCGYHYNTIKNSAGNWTSNGAGRVWVVFFDKSDVKFANLRTKNGTGLSGIDLEAITNKKKLTNFNFTKYDTSAWRCKDTCFTVTKKWDYVAFYLEATDHNLNIYLDDVAINEVKPDAGKDKDTCVKRNSTVAVKIGKPTCSTFMTENITYEVDPTGFPTFPNTASSLPITLTFNSVLSNPTVYRESHTVIIRRSLGNCEDFDTVVITFKPRPEAILLKDTVICAPPNSYKLTVITNPPTPPNFKYLWSTGDTTDTFTIRKSGRYYVRVTDTNACYTDTSQKITFRPEIILPEDTTLCTKALQKGLKLKVKSGYVEYKWRKDTKTSTVLRTTDTFTVFTPGRYWIYVKDSFGCNKHDSIRIYANDPIFDLGANDTACDQYTLCADTIKFPNYKHKWQKKNNTSGVWSTIGYSNCITITDSGINWIKLTQYSQPDSCYFTDSIKIVIKKATKIHCSGLGPFCANDSNNYLLDSICLPTGGKWNRTFPSNNSVSFNAINPAVLHANLGVGTHDFIYSYTDPTTGCFTADTIHITIYGLDTPDIIEDTFCQSNIPQLLKFTPSGGTWSSNVSSGYFTPSTAGWHKVWYKTTNTHGCSNADTAYILVKEQIVGGINLLTDTTGLCFPDTSVELEAYWNTATNYNYHFKWLYNNSTNSKVKITKNGTYKVVITSDSTPCPDTVSITINLPNCCNLNTNLLHGTLTNASITAGNYVLDGELRITGIVTIDNAHIYVKDCHAIIIVEQGARLEIRNSHIGYCPWKGIEVWGSIDACSSDTGVGCGQGELFMQGSIIDFAEIGVFAGTRTVLTNSCYSTSIDRQLLGGAVIKIFYSTFRHNNVDILFSEFNVGGFCVCGNLSSNSPSNGVIYSQIEHNIFGLLSDTFYRCEGENNNNTWLGQFFIAYDAAHGSSNWRNSCRHIIDCNENPDAWSDPYCHGNNISCCTGSNVNNSYFGNHANNPNPFQQSIFENNSYSPTCTGTPPYH